VDRKIRSFPEAFEAIEMLLVGREEDLARIKDLERQIDLLARGRLLDRRRPPRVPAFPDTLRLYGYTPKSEAA